MVKEKTQSPWLVYAGVAAGALTALLAAGRIGAMLATQPPEPEIVYVEVPATAPEPKVIYRDRPAYAPQPVPAPKKAAREYPTRWDSHSGFTLTDLAENADGDGLIGEIRNDTPDELAGGFFELAIYDGRELVGVEMITILNLAAGDSKPFSIYTDALPANPSFRFTFSHGY